MLEDDELGFAVPNEDGLAWAVPTGAPHVNNALKWINHFYALEVQSEIQNTNRYGPANSVAKEFINSDDVSSPVIYPPT